ncbi:hypothetical protein ACFXAW_06940 [Streptomyces sp. NPDC059445]|uniref:hypothetical protein n=1 Tax=Streptomyces sp. NPDC059445 TaxID=3346832 RepID=UPI0036BDF68B
MKGDEGGKVKGGKESETEAGKQGGRIEKTADVHGGKTEEQGKTEIPGPDGRTDSQIRSNLEKQTGKSFEQLVLSLKMGPIDASKISPRQVEEKLESMGVRVRIERENKEPTVIDKIAVPHPYQGGRFVEEGRVGPASKVDEAKAAGNDAVNRAIISGLMAAAKGMKPGAASEGLVRPGPEIQIRGYEPRPPTTYDATRGANKPESPSTIRELAGPRPGELNAAKGFQNETTVANLTGGTLARGGKISESGALGDAVVRYTMPNGQGGVARVDVYGPNRELIQVGGPAKADNLSKTTNDLTSLQRAAAASGVGAEAYFTSDTPKQVLDAAKSVLGADHVHTFERPEYRTR